jgi:hypothetical protein
VPVHERPVRHLPVASIAATLLVAATIVLYRSGLIGGMSAAFGPTAIGLIVLAHLGALAAIGTCLVALRRRPRRNRRK